MIELKNQTLLVIAPHPDDETIGCGGLIAKLKKAGSKVFVLCVCVGDHKQYGSISDSKKRIDEFKKVMTYLQVDDYEIVYNDDEHHLKLDTLPLKDLIDLFENDSKVAINKIKPTMLSIPFGGSYFQDHIAVFNAAFAACRPRPRKTKHMVDTVLVYDVPSDGWSRERFKPNFYVSIAEELATKLKALSMYKSQTHPEPHPCSIENVERIAKMRGNLIGTGAAEVFDCLRSTLL